MKKKIISMLLVAAIMIVNCFMTSNNIGEPLFIEMLAKARENCSSNFNNDYTLCNDGAENMIRIARAQLGRNGGQFGYTEEWCADFVIDCAIKAGETNAIPNTAENAACRNLINSVKNAGGIEVSASDARVGDLLFYYNGTTYCHIEIVYAQNGSTLNSISTIGGNSGNSNNSLSQVKDHRNQSGMSPYKVIRPKYSNNPVSKDFTITLDEIVNLGDDFTAIIKNVCGKPIMVNNDNKIVMGTENIANLSKYLWRFTRNSDGSYRIKTYYNQKSLDVFYAKDEDGAVIGVSDDNDYNAEKWYLYKSGTGYKLKSGCAPSRAMDMFCGNSNDGNIIDLWTDCNVEQQTFTITKTSEYADFGTDFSAIIKNVCGKPIMVNNDNKIVMGTENIANLSKYLWRFTRNSDGSYRIKTYYNQKSLDVFYAKDEDGAVIGVSDDNDYNAEKWYIIPSGDGFKLKSGCAPSRAMDMFCGNSDDGNVIDLWADCNVKQQTFTITKKSEYADFGTDFSAIIKNVCGKPIMVNNDNKIVMGTENIANLSRYLWRFTRNSDGSYRIKTYYNQKSLDVFYGKDEDGAVIGVSDDNDYNAEKWYIIPSGDGFKLKSGCAPSRAMDMFCGNSDDGNVIDLWTDYNVKQQTFTITKKNITYKLKLDANGGNVSITSKDTTFNQKYGSLPTPTKNGYVFDGWYTSKTGGIKVTSDTIKLNLNDETVYAHWKETPVTTITTKTTTTPVITTKAATTTTTPVTTTKAATTTTTPVTTVPDITELNINKSSITLKNGEQFTIIANQTGLIYKSNNTDIAVVSKTGIVTAIGEGNAIISVINTEGDVAQLKVEVVEPILKGDCNADGKISVTDIVMFQKWFITSDSKLTNPKAADLDENGIINISDFCLMKHLILAQK